MSENIYEDVYENEIILTHTVRDTILIKHPEVEDFIDRVELILREPDKIYQSARDERVVLYYRFAEDVLNGKWLVVVVKRVDRHFVSTIYATDKIKSGELLWKKNE